MSGTANVRPPQKPKGIQFVKSSETLVPKSESLFVDNNCGQPSSSNSPTPYPTFTRQNPSNVYSNSPGGSQQQPRFGAPAVNFSGVFKDKASAKYTTAFVKSGESYSSVKNEPSQPRSNYRMPGFNDLNQGAKAVPPIPKITQAEPMCSTQEYLKAWKEEKDPFLVKIRKLAHEVVTLKSDRPNAKDKLHSAANRVPMRIEFNTEPIMGAKGSRPFMCHVFIDNIKIASGQGAKIKDSKSVAYELALQKVLTPHMRVISTDPTWKTLQVSRQAFTSPLPDPVKFPVRKNESSSQSQLKESNLEAAGLKRRYNEYKSLDEFVIVEPKIPIPDCTATHTLRRSADFNHMLLEYEYFFKGESARCILKIENEVLADVNGSSKGTAKNIASAQALVALKKFCWIIKTKQAVDTNSRISKDEIVNELNEQSDSIGSDNLGNKMLRKMGWSGGGVGKDGDGIAEPVSLKSVLNREGLGLGTSKGITNEFRKKIKDVIENYASSENQEDLVFSYNFRLEERQVIHDECRRLNLRSKSKGKGNQRYLCVRRKRSVNQLFDHLMSVGGETARYQLIPPGRDVDVPVSMPTNSDQISPLMALSSSSSSLPAFNNAGTASPFHQAGSVFSMNNANANSGGGGGARSLLQTPSSMSNMMGQAATKYSGGGGFQFGNAGGSGGGMNRPSYRFGNSNSNSASSTNNSNGSQQAMMNFDNNRGRLSSGNGNGRVPQMSNTNSDGMGRGGGSDSYYNGPQSYNNMSSFGGSGGWNNTSPNPQHSRNNMGMGQGHGSGSGMMGQGHGSESGIMGQGHGSGFGVTGQGHGSGSGMLGQGYGNVLGMTGQGYGNGMEMGHENNPRQGHGVHPYNHQQYANQRNFGGGYNNTK